MNLLVWITTSLSYQLHSDFDELDVEYLILDTYGEAMVEWVRENSLTNATLDKASELLGDLIQYA